ncbi:mechanosensitive ion channel family protein [Seleniivibrio woodruffii]|uniref:Miniconductance mechanosensitive channel n=1 Tax=Seleniivibrio woodruffii TaxID=1078050 RepID=A0A4R1KBA0_9BACT|nr:mechanosensitive ion channel domain-containing protein [Seleniivibrio woodruffii]TCK61745.1 miniconductance mechanosensitive channel [Seleniivibrio woodruffii]TVZ35140.1 miniconductance mechanosensitive channel [Seleniivibrio woodruffii]
MNNPVVQRIMQFLMESSEYFVVLFIAALSYFIIKKILVRAIHRYFEKTENHYDDILIESNIFSQLAYIAPALVFIYASDIIVIPKYVTQIIAAYIAVNITVFIIRLTSVINSIYSTFEIAARRPIKGYIQMVQVIAGFLGAIISVCMLIGKSPLGILSGLGAMTAILMLIFKDTIMSFIAGMQIMFNDLVHKGDWIEMPAFGVDGTVLDIALYTVKVENFDKTIVTVPTSKLIEGSFKNYRGMRDAGGRRIKRTIIIDQSTIRFLKPEDIDKFRRIGLINKYLDSKLSEDIDPTGCDINKRRLTNIGTFRAYVREYLKNNKNIHKDFTLIVRQMAPTSEGLPIEIYAFVCNTDWGFYEDVQADIFDHLTAVIREFDLRIYQHISDKTQI